MKTKIDLNTVLGFVLIGAILYFFNFFNTPDKEVESTENTEIVADSTKVETQSEPEAEVTTLEKQSADSLVVDTNAELDYDTYGPFAQSMLNAKPEQTVVIENELLRVEISSIGAQLTKANLKNYQTYDSLPLYLINHNASFNIALVEGKRFYTADLVFVPKKINDQTAEFTLYAENGRTLTYRYSLAPNSYMLDWDVVSNNMADYLPNGAASLTWEMNTLRHEKNKKAESTNTKIQYRYTADDDVDDIVGTGDKEKTIDENIKWVGYQQQFFSSILLNKNGNLKKTQMVHKVLEEDSLTKYFASNTSVAAGTDGDLNTNFGLYLGPNKYDILKSYDQEFDQLIPLGWGIFGWINRGLVINVFNWLDKYNMNYGLIILIIALIFKMILAPLTYQSYRSMAKMRVLKPEIDEINEKFKDKDQMKKQQATMELYQKAGVNPLGGCLPMLFQMPILIALFRFFPASIELRQKSFLWADDLSTYDSIWDLPFNIPFYGDHVSLFTLLMTVSTLIYTYMNQQLTGSAQNQQFPQMKYMIYLMPVVFLGVFNNYSSGLSYYYFVANMITFGQQFAIRAMLNDDKIHAKIQANKSKPKKENRIMRRMNEMQEAQNRQTRRKK